MRPVTDWELESRKYGVGGHTMVARRVEKLFGRIELVCDETCECKKVAGPKPRAFLIRSWDNKITREGVQFSNGKTVVRRMDSDNVVVIDDSAGYFSEYTPEWLDK